MRKLNIRPHLRRTMAATLAIIMAMSLAVPVFAAEPEDTGPDLEAIAALFVDWDGSYELPDLSELSEEDREAVKAMVDAIMLAREAETQAETEAPMETGTETDVPLTISFSDVPSNHQFYRGIMYCAGKGIVNGYDDGTFKPARNVAKSHFCAMLARAFYADQIARYDTDQYKKAYGTFGPTNMTLASNGTLNDTSFRWSYTNGSIMASDINRYDMAQLMTNIMKAKGFTATSSQKSAAQSKITDYKNIPSKYQDAVKNVYALGVIGGYGDGSFKGDNIMNRGQAAIVIQRMAQYAPVKGDNDNDQYDDGKEKPSTSNPGTSSGNTGSNTGSTSTGNTGNTGSNTGSTGTTTTKPETKPETPATRTLSNGKAITESNVTAILKQLESKYPNKTSFGGGYASLSSSRNANNNCISQVTKQYIRAANQHGSSTILSTTAGCGGWAAFVCDEVFGQTNVTWRQTTLSSIRPGDLMIKIDDGGHLTHVQVYVEPVSGYTSDQIVRVASASGATASSYKISWPECVTLDVNYDVYTAYPD